MDDMPSAMSLAENTFDLLGCQNVRKNLSSHVKFDMKMRHSKPKKTHSEKKPLNGLQCDKIEKCYNFMSNLK